ncbi:MAG: response regulator transcription factor [Dehalococcoidia bacterium]|nr:response regulator transcription factor [Dehalococcoidia bacterium]
MQTTPTHPGLPGLPPPLGLKLLVVSFGLERAYDRARGLEDSGYRVVSCGEPSAIDECVESAMADAVIVDLARELAFPGDIVARVRERSQALIVVVGCAGTYPEMLRCYEAGADEYCRPRCQTEELDLRIRAMFRRMQSSGVVERQPQTPSVLRVGEIEIDPASQLVRKNGLPVALSPTEFRLLATLAEHPGEVIPSRALIARVWGNQYAGEAHYLRLYVRYLRQKLEDDPSNPRYIVNRWGSGYALEAPARAVA